MSVLRPAGYPEIVQSPTAGVEFSRMFHDDGLGQGEHIVVP
jgi:hypothetical protein